MFCRLKMVKNSYGCLIDRAQKSENQYLILTFNQLYLLYGISGYVNHIDPLVHQVRLHNSARR